MKTSLSISLAFIAAIFSTALLAHTGHATFGLSAGFAHPFFGLDHLLAMVAVGIWAAQLGGGAQWALPLTFIALMAAGGTLGLIGLNLPFVEHGILLSVIVLGAVIALASRFPLIISLVLVGGFALFHGVAHGAEIPALASAPGYCVGFLVGTALLHLGGVLAARGLVAFNALALRFLGGAIALAGLALGVL